MPDNGSRLKSGRGITVLSLLLLIIALVVVAIFLVRYLRTATS
jgi:flagellar biogenesis protein FliO